MESMQAAYDQDPNLQKKIEAQLSHIHELGNKAALEKDQDACPTGGTITIPVVVHVLYDPNSPATNISEAQIESQICQLNADYAGTNQDLLEALDGDGNKDLVEAIANASSTGTCIQFCLATFDHPVTTTLNPNGLEDGDKAIVRRSLAGLPTDFPASFGGSPGVNNDPWEISPIWNNQEYLNFWVVPSISINGNPSVLGFAQFPGGPSNTDGVVIRAQNFGASSPDCGPCSGCLLQSNYDWGRTATHEVGHWLSLYHTWGVDTGCGGSGDEIFDTPDQFASSSQFFCNVSGFPVLGDQCTPSSQGGIMYMNYMDYSADACLILFSNGQQSAMEQVLTNGLRSNMGTNDLEEIKCTPITDPPIANFTYSPDDDPVVVCTTNGKIEFTDTSQDNPTQWTWSFTVLNGDIGLDIITSSNKNPEIEVIAGTSGTIEAELVVSNSLGNSTSSQTISVEVSEDVCPSCEGGILAGEDVTICPNEPVTLTASTGSIGGSDDTVTASIDATDFTGVLQSCIVASQQPSIDVTAFTFSVPPMNTNITQIGPGSIKELCVNISVTNNNGTYLSLDHGNGAWEDLWIGTSFTDGLNGNGGNTIDVCFTAGEATGAFDGVFDGDGNPDGGNFVGQPTFGSWILYVQDLGCFLGGTEPPTINSASLVFNDGGSGFDCQFVRWEVSGFEVGTDPSIEVTSANGGTVFYTAVADCGGFICTDEVAVTVLPNVASGLSTTVGTAENPYAVCGNDDTFDITSAGPYAYDATTQTIAWGLWVIEDPLGQTGIDAGFLPGSPPSDDNVTDDDNFLGFYGTNVVGATGDGTVSLPVRRDGVTYYLAPMIINIDNTFEGECAGVSPQGTYVKQYIALNANASTNACSEDEAVTTLSFDGGLPFDDYFSNNPNHTEAYTVSVVSDADPATELVPAGQEALLWDNASLDLPNLPLGTYSLTLTDAIGCQLVQTFSVSPDCEADIINQIDDLNGPPVQLFPDMSNQFMEAADDFFVSSDGLTIDAVKVTGSFSGVGTTVNSVKVTITVDFFNEPGPSVVFSENIVPADATDPNFYLPLANSLDLVAGKYWISVVPEMSFEEDRQWFWDATDVQTGDMALFRDSGDEAFIDWVPVNGNVGNAAAVDLSFAFLQGASAGTPDELVSNLLCCEENIDLTTSGANYDCTSFRMAWAVAPSDDVAGVEAAIAAGNAWFGDENDAYNLAHSCVDGLEAGKYYAIPFLANKYEDSPTLIEECSIVSEGLEIGLVAPIEAASIGILCALGENEYNVTISGLTGGANNGGNPVLEDASYVFEDGSGTLTATYDSMNDTYTIENLSIADFNGYTLTISNSIAGQTDNCGVAFDGFTEPNCCDPNAGLPQAPADIALCSDGTGEWTFAASAGFDTEPSTGLVGTPDYAYLITSAGAVSIVQAISSDGSYTTTDAGTVCVYGFAYNGAALQAAGMDLEDFVGASTFSMGNDLDAADLCYAIGDDAAYCLEAYAAIEGALVTVDCAASGESGTLTVDLSSASGGSGNISVAANSPDKNGDAMNSFPYAYTVIVTDGAGCELELTGNVNCDVTCTPDAGVLTAPNATEVCMGDDGADFAAPSFSTNPSGFGADAYVYVVVDNNNEITGVSNDGAFTAINSGGYCVYGLAYDDAGSVNPSTFVGSGLSALNTALNNASVCFDLTDDSYCVEAYGAIEGVQVFTDCELGGASGTLQVSFEGASGGSSSGYAVASNSPDKVGDVINNSPYNYTVIVVDGFGCETTLTGETGCVPCPTISSVSPNADACSGETVDLTVDISDFGDQLDEIEWTNENGTVLGSSASIEVSEEVTGCSNLEAVYTVSVICNDGFVVTEQVTITYYPQVSATTNVSGDGCTITAVPACPQYVIEGWDAGQTAVVSTEIDGDNSAVSFNVSNPGAPMACSSTTVSANYDCILPECPTIGSIVELGKSAVDFSVCSGDQLNLEITLNDPNNQLDRVEWTAASLANPVVGTQIMISEMATGCDTEVVVYTATAYCSDGSATTETVNVTVYPLPDADVEVLDGGCTLQATPTCSDFAIDGNAAGETVMMNAEPGDQSSVTFNVVNTTAVNDGVNCGAMEISASFNCAACAANAGTMPAEELWICDGDRTELQTSGETLGMGDVLTYILHDSPSTTLGQVLAEDELGRFDAMDAGTTLTRYYVSAIVGPDADNNGTPDVEDACTIIAPGTPVRFLNPITSTVSYDVSTTPNSVDATFTITGGASELDGSTYNVTLSSGGALDALHDTPFTVEGLTNGTELDLEVMDANNCSNMFNYTDIEESEILAASFVIKPVPAKDFLQLSFNATSAANANVSIYSVDGQLILSASHQGRLGENQMELNLQSLPTGMYFLSLNYDGMVVNRKLVKQ